MQLIEKHIIKSSHVYFRECDELAFLSKNLYNKANYIVRQEFIFNHNYLNYYEMNRLLIDENGIDYTSLPRKVSNGILRLLDKNWKSFFKASKEFGNNPSKFTGKPSLPRYKNVKSGRNVLPYEKGAISKSELIKNGIIKLSKTDIKIRTKISYEDLQAVRVVPKYGSYVVEVIYNKEEEDYGLNKKNVLGIDLGVNNFSAVGTTKGDVFIINGKPLKSINQYYNKKKARLQSLLKDNRKHSKNISKLTNKRNNKVNDFLHKSSRYIIDYCLTNDIGRIVIGNNEGWKQKINIGKKNNQNFVSIPYKTYIEMLRYKSEMVGIKFEVKNESHTSKCDFLSVEDVKHHKNYLGKRVKRGLFKSATGVLINADINGALNIIKKVVPMFAPNRATYGIEGFAVNPTKINFS